MHVKWSLFLVQALPGYPVLGKDNCTFPLAGLPQVRSARKSGTGGGKHPSYSSSSLWAGKARDTSVSWAKEGASWGESQSPGLCCYSRRCQAALLTLFLYQRSRTSSSQFLKYGCREDRAPLLHTMCDQLR